MSSTRRITPHRAAATVCKNTTVENILSVVASKNRIDVYLRNFKYRLIICCMIATCIGIVAT
jgi:DNA integrity scanning protein DisA with diadenylate cyclase activity